MRPCRTASVATRKEYVTNSARNHHREQLGALIAARFAELTGEQATRALAEVPVAHARVNTMHDVWEHPQLAARDRWHRVATPAGEVKRATGPRPVALPGLPGLPASVVTAPVATTITRSV